MAFNPDSADFWNAECEEERINQLLQYLQRQSPDVLSQVAKSVPPDVKQIVSQNVQGLVGALPTESFNVQIVTDRENLAGLLASAMMTGYFLRQMEQRMHLEEALLGSISLGGEGGGGGGDRGDR
ncbi:MAG: DUF760 domain-containing protein [Cyanophyceae cyanobacterium]